MSTRTRVRDIPDWRSQVPAGVHTTWTVRKSDGFVLSPKVTTTERFGHDPSLSGRQSTADENHPEWRMPHGTFLEDRGGPFRTERRTILVERPITYYCKGGYDPGDGTYINATYHGAVLAHSPGFLAYPPSIASSEAVLRKKGAEAVARCSPVNVPADLSVFLAELKREGLPRLAGSAIWKEKSRPTRKRVADEHLNLEFGWKPVIADVKALAETFARADEILSQYERGSGSLTRRGWLFPIEETTSVSTVSSNALAVTSPDAGFLRLPTGVDPTTSRFLHRTTYRKVWFEGAFTYHLPTGWTSRNALVSIAAKARTLLGLDLTPDVLWNLTPWSWAVDWFSNVGDVIKNLSDYANDGVVMKYGYVMEHTICRDRYIMDGRGRLGGFPKTARPSPVVASVETKQRVKASPFGFGVTWGGLSPRQLSIAAALGISRGR